MLATPCSGWLEADYSGIFLVHLLIAVVETVATQDMDLASMILAQLKELTSCAGNTMQQVAAYFSDGLQCRIEGGRALIIQLTTHSTVTS